MSSSFLYFKQFSKFVEQFTTFGMHKDDKIIFFEGVLEQCDMQYDRERTVGKIYTIRIVLFD